MEDEDYKVVDYKGKTFKCFRDGRCFVWRSYAVKIPFWNECKGVYKDTNTDYYRYTNRKGGFKVRIHRLLAQCFLGLDINDLTKVVDHLDGNGLNNNFENLRVVDHTTNCRNLHKVQGVSTCGNGYRAYIGKNGNRQTKYFKTKEEALKWRQEKEIELGYITRAKGM